MSDTVYFAFASGYFYPEGGWKDFIGAYDSPEACIRAMKKWAWENNRLKYGDWQGHFVNMTTLEVTDYEP